MNRHHAFAIEAEAEEGIGVAEAWVERELGMRVKNNPDVATLRYGLLSVEDARRIVETAISAAFGGAHKVVIIAASRAYHEAQNALLKLFEEPPPGAHLFLILPTLGNLLPTLRSRVQVLRPDVRLTKSNIWEAAREFLEANKEGRGAIIKKLTSGKDEEEKRELRDEALAIINGIEAAAYHDGLTKPLNAELLREIQVLRGHLHDRSAPVRMILEHISLVIPKNLL